MANLNLKYPYSQLHIGQSYTIGITGPYIKVLNTETGLSITSTDHPDSQTLSRSGPIRFSCVNEAFTHLITVSEDKKLKVWQVEGLKLLCERELPKKPTQIWLTRDGQTVIVSDKFGDVFSYSLHQTSTDTLSRDAVISRENRPDGTLVLGHVSLVTTFLLTPDEDYIITADRDEHIRVSWYPQGYNIETYCLGHEKFVSALHIPPFNPSLLISAGGDVAIKVWDWMTGSLRCEIRVDDAVEPFIVVKGKVRKWADNELIDGEDSIRTRSKRARGRSRRKGKNREKREIDVEMENEDSADGVLPAGQDSNIGDDEPHHARVETEQLVLAIHNLSSLQKEHGSFLIFDVYGSTALFCVKYLLEGPSSPNDIRHYDFHKPILDFVIHDGLIWVLLDGGWGNDGQEREMNMLRVIKWVTDSEQFVEIDEENRYNHLITSLNTSHLMNATSEELKSLDLYANLTALPKNVDLSRDPMKMDIEERAESAIEEGRDITNRELGRLKHKKALAERLRQDDEDDEVTERESKKLKSNTTCDNDQGGIEDV